MNLILLIVNGLEHSVAIDIKYKGDLGTLITAKNGMH